MESTCGVLGAYAQDEWRITSRATLNYGLRYERINPFTEVEDRLNAFSPGVQSQVRPDAPAGLLFPGDPGVPRGIAQSVNAFMPRAGIAWDPTGTGTWAVRASYGLFYDQFQNGAGTASQVAISAIPAAQFVQFSGAGLNFQNPYLGRDYPAANTFVRPSTVFALDLDTKPPQVQNWNVGVQRSLFDKYVIEVRYVGASAIHLPRNVEANPAVYGPGATAQNADRRRIYANCPADGSACDFSTVAMLESVARSRYDAGQFSLSRRFGDAVGFNVSYWLSKTMDHLSAMNLSGAAARPLAGENDLAQNPFDLEAEWGPSLFDARHRLVASASWLPQMSSHGAGRRTRTVCGLAVERDRHVQLGNAVHRLGLGQRRTAGQQPPDLGLSGQPSQRRRRSRMRDRTRRTSGSADRRSSGSTSRRRRDSSATRAGTSRAGRHTRTSICRSCATSTSPERRVSSSGRKSSTCSITPTSACPWPT